MKFGGGVRLAVSLVWLVVFVTWPRPTAAVTLLGIGGGMIVYNALVFRDTVVRGGDAPSVLPLFGGIIAAAGVVVLPVQGAWMWAWLPLLIDWGGLPMLMMALYQRLTGLR